jgi:hypothetical protein
MVRREVLERAAPRLLGKAVALEAVLLDDRPLLLVRGGLAVAVPDERTDAGGRYDAEESDGDDELARDGRTPYSVATRSAGDRGRDHSSK